MNVWRPQSFRTAARLAGRDNQLVERAVSTAQRVSRTTPGAAPILSLKHLGHLTDTAYSRLRSVTNRSEPEPYHVFKIHKRPLPGENRRFRTIVVPAPWLMSLQRWMNANILAHVAPHPASVAFRSGCNIRDAAALHCGSRWILKLDLRNFFESVTERQVQRLFSELGYQRLVAFELARLCTRLGDRRTRLHHSRFASRPHWSKITTYSQAVMGHLPQGAPTSPHLANLVARGLDTALTDIADAHGLTYSRYADDLTFSTGRELERSAIRPIIGDIYGAIAQNGFSPNAAKTNVLSPGSRKLVLGLLVDRDEPRLTRAFKSNLRCHLHHLTVHGPVEHAASCNGTVFGIRRHVLGLIQHARQIEPSYGDNALERFNRIRW